MVISRYPGRRRLIKQRAHDGTLTARQAVYLDYGRKIRNGMARGRTRSTAVPPALAVPMAFGRSGLLPGWRERARTV
jgi:hypothetical protein